jgi:hypothetical protein
MIERLLVTTCTQPNVQLEGPQCDMGWGPSQRLMYVAGPGGVYACRKALLKHCLRDDVIAIQVRSTMFGR